MALARTQPILPPKSGVLGARSPRRLPQQQLDLSEWKDRVVSGASIARCPTDTLLKLIPIFKQDRDTLIRQGDSVGAQEAEAHLNYVKRCATDALKVEARDHMQASLETRIEKARNDYTELVRTIASQEAEMRRQFAAQLDALHKKHAKETAAFDSSWTQPEKERGYNRTSGSLKELRRQAALLLKDRRFQESKKVDMIADNLEKEEVIRSCLRMEADYGLQAEILLALQQREEEELLRKQKVREGEYEAAKKFELDAAKRRIHNLETERQGKSDPDKVWALYHRNDTGRTRLTQSLALFPGKRRIDVNQFNTLTLPPLRDSMAVKRAVETANRTRRAVFFQ